MVAQSQYGFQGRYGLTATRLAALEPELFGGTCVALARGIAGVAFEVAKIVFFVALILFAISAVVGLLRGRSPIAP